MHEGIEIAHPGDDASCSLKRSCPDWCATRHGSQLGEEDWIHVGAPLTVAEGVTAQLCLSVDPDSGDEDGPFVLIGSSEYTPAEAAGVGRALMELAAAAGDG